jgi:hypothetical protein
MKTATSPPVLGRGADEGSAFAGPGTADDALARPANNDALAGRADLPRMRTKAARALSLARPAGGNHTRQGTGFRSGLGFAVSPLTRVVGLRPGRPRMRTLKAHLFRADALWAFSGADLASFALGGADLARQLGLRGDLRSTSLGGTNARTPRSRALTPTLTSATPHKAPPTHLGGRPCSILSVVDGRRGFARGWVRANGPFASGSLGWPNAGAGLCGENS